MERSITVEDLNKIIEFIKDLRDITYSEIKPEINEALLHLERAKFILIELKASRARES